MSFCEEWPASPASFGPLSNFLSPAGASSNTTGLNRSTARPDFHQAADMLLEERQGLDHLADPLPGQILEIAGLENLHHAVADVVGETLLVLALEPGGQRVGALVDVLGRLQQLLGRLLGAAHDRVELAARPRDVGRQRAAAGKRGDLLAAALERRVDRLELGLVGLRLGDLRARRLHRGAVRLGARLDQAAQRLDLRHELMVAQRGLGVARGNVDAPAGARVLLDAENLALNRHQPNPRNGSKRARFKIGFTRADRR